MIETATLEERVEYLTQLGVKNQAMLVLVIEALKLDFITSGQTNLATHLAESYEAWKDDRAELNNEFKARNQKVNELKHEGVALLITQCPDSQRWYSALVGKSVPYLSDNGHEYVSRQEAGHINFVQYEDARIVNADGSELQLDLELSIPEE